MRARRADTSLQRACSAVLDDNGPQAVTVTADRCSSEHPQLGSGSIGTARARLSSPPDRLDAGPGATPGPGRGPWRPLLIRFTGTAWHGSGTVDPQVKRRARPGEVQPRLGLEQAHRVRTRPLPRPSSLPG